MFSIDNMEVSMKLKYCIGIIVLLLVFYIAGLTAMPKRAILEINKITLYDETMDDALMNYYGLQQNETNKGLVKRVGVQCEIKNISLIRKISNVEITFDENQPSLGISIGTRVDFVEPDSLILKPHQKKKRAFAFLVDTCNYSDDEVISMLGNLNLQLIEHHVNADKILLEHPVKCKVE